MENIPDKIDSKFRYVLLAANRAEQMMRGAQPKVDAEDRKITRVALEEVRKDLVEWDYGPEEIPEDEAFDEEGAEALPAAEDTLPDEPAAAD